MQVDLTKVTETIVTVLLKNKMSKKFRVNSTEMLETTKIGQGVSLKKGTCTCLA